MKCPFCQQELEICGMYIDGTSKIWCSKCKLFGDSRLFEKLITTKKALDVAVDALKRVRKCHNHTTDEGFVAYEALYKLGEIEPINEKEDK